MKLDTNNLEFQTALDLIQETNQSFFLTGKAGTGKSTFLKHIVEIVSKNFVVVAPTGIAAVNVGGVTLCWCLKLLWRCSQGHCIGQLKICGYPSQ